MSEKDRPNQKKGHGSYDVQEMQEGFILSSQLYKTVWRAEFLVPPYSYFIELQPLINQIEKV